MRVTVIIAVLRVLGAVVHAAFEVGGDAVVTGFEADDYGVIADG